MPYCTALRTTSFNDCSQCRTLRRGWSLVLGALSTSRCTLVLHSLHWLPVRQPVTFRLTTFVHKCLNDQAPTYLADFCRQTGDRRSRMRSAETWILHVPCMKSTYGDRSFAVAGPSIWNSLPPAIRDPSLSSQGFRRLLKTRLFGQWLRASAFELAPEKCTYLLTYIGRAGRKSRIHDHRVTMILTIYCHFMRSSWFCKIQH